MGPKRATPLGPARAGRRRQRDPDRRLLRSARPGPRAGRRGARDRAARTDRDDDLRRHDDPRGRAAPRRPSGPARPDRLEPAAGAARAPPHAAALRRARGRHGVGVAGAGGRRRAARDAARRARHPPPRAAPPAAHAARGGDGLPDAASRVRAGPRLGRRRSARARSCSRLRARRARASSGRSRSSSGRSRSASAPIYVRKQIVHNAHVVAELERRGAVFVEELDEVPAGSTVIFSAHGVSPAVRAAGGRARARGDRRDLPAGRQGPRRGAAVRVGGDGHRARRPRGPRGGRGDLGRGARPDARDRERRRGRLAPGLATPRRSPI